MFVVGGDIDHGTLMLWTTFGRFAGCLAITLISILLSVPGAHAATCSAQDNYEGTANGSWSTGTWSKGKPPAATETACIPEGKGTIEVPAGITASVKTLLAQSAVTIAATATLAISETVVPEDPKSDEERATRFSGLTIDQNGIVSTAGAWILMTGPVALEGEIKSTAAMSAKEEDVARLLGGTLSGDGKIDMPFANIAGTVQPGGPGVVGALTFTYGGDQQSGGTLVLDIASETSFDRFDLSAGFSWFGTLEVNLIDGYEPPVGTQFFFQNGSTIGGFETITPGFEELTEPDADTIRVKPRKPTVLTEEATDVTQTSAVLHATVNPNLEQVSICKFEFRMGGSLIGSQECPTPPGKGSAPVAETLALSNLTPDTTYEYEIEATNQGAGTATGAIVSFTTLPASKETEKPVEKPEEIPGEKAPPQETPSTSGNGSSATALVSNMPSGSLPAQTPVAPVATAPAAVEELLLGCSKRSLVLNDVLVNGGHVLLDGSAAKSLVGSKVKILFDANRQVASAVVQADGQFATTAPLPPAKLRDSNNARYVAVSGSQRSLNLKLTRRLVLQQPTFAAGSVTLTGQVQIPLTKPISTVTVEQQLECGKTTKVMTFTPPASGRFHVTVSGIPADAKAGIYRLATNVLQNPRSHHPFPTYSLPLPTTLG
jgi:hypothetical protein